ncbi:MAG TPA: hypothetical protein VI259_08445 [Gemmatimonadaceae bacterium]
MPDYFKRMMARLVLPLTLAACLSSAVSGPELSGVGTPVLFVGNSLTYVNDLPGIVQALADSAGGPALAVETVAFPDYALIDHWNEGVAAGRARGEIAKGGWKFVVLQQGPSSVDVNRDTLRLATKLFAQDMAKVGATPALLSAWPTIDRRQDFPRAIESYTLAASDVHGVLLPVAAAWLAAWKRDSTLALYSDGLHPSIAGSYLSALAVYAALQHHSPVGLPSRLHLRSGATLFIDPKVAALLQAAAAEATGW